MRDRQSELHSSNISPVVVSFDGDILAENYLRQMEIEWPLLRDTDMELYRRYGMHRGDWWDLFGPRSIWKYLKLIYSGHRPGQPGKDWQQLGGDILIDPDGIVRLHYVSETPHDRPNVDQILQLVKT